jgi:DNA-binding beta-propeller fold protein YncE
MPVLTSLPHVPRVLLAIAAALSLVAVLTVPADARQGPPGHATAAQRHEVWMLDQGTDLIHVVDSHRYQETATIDVSPSALRDADFPAAPTAPRTVPHMIEFDSQERYAFIASTVGGVTIVVDAHTKQVVEVLPTGAGTHMAAVTPDDSAVWVAVIGTPGRVADGSQKLVEIPLRLDQRRPSFAIGRTLPTRDLLEDVETRYADGWEGATFPSFSPVCHQYSPDSKEAWITFGPSWNQGGLAVLDLASGELSAAFDPREVKANCGISVTEDRALANWSGAVVSGGDSDGETYVFDREEKQLLRTIDTEGTDTHGLRLTPDGTTYWQVNRNSGNVQTIDASSFVLTETGLTLDTPDILDYSPDGSTVYVTQRGPSPRSGAIHAASGDDPGIAVVDTATARVLTTIRPPTVVDTAGVVQNDVHGVGVRTSSPGDRGQTQAERVRRPAVVPTRTDGDASGFHCGLPAA